MKGDFDKMIVFFVFLRIIFQSKTPMQTLFILCIFFDFMAVVKGIFFIIVFFHFQKCLSRSNSGHKIKFPKKEKSEISSKNSKKV